MVLGRTVLTKCGPALRTAFPGPVVLVLKFRDNLFLGQDWPRKKVEVLSFVKEVWYLNMQILCVHTLFPSLPFPPLLSSPLLSSLLLNPPLRFYPSLHLLHPLPPPLFLSYSFSSIPLPSPFFPFPLFFLHRNLYGDNRGLPETLTHLFVAFFEMFFTKDYSSAFAYDFDNELDLPPKLTHLLLEKKFNTFL
jgi:hypothetical protein